MSVEDLEKSALQVERYTGDCEAEAQPEARPILQLADVIAKAIYDVGVEIVKAIEAAGRGR